MTADVTVSATRITVPDVAISEVSEASNKAPEGSPTSATTSVQQVCIRAVITAGYFDDIPLNEPECR